MKMVFTLDLKKAFGTNSFFFIICLFFFIQDTIAQDSLGYRKKIVTYGSAASYGITLIGLNQLWYKDYPQRSFHFFNDNNQWLQIDKIGHAYSTYVLGKTSSAAFKWAGFSRNEASLYGSGGSFLFLTTIEIFDGFNKNWGFSYGDLIANAFGNGLYLAQELFWQEQKILLKFSYSPTSYRAIRPSVLGENETQAILKDYNGQTYWASFNLHSFIPAVSNKWLNIAIGMGGSKMLYAKKSGGSGFLNEHQREWYLSPDVDFERIQTKKKGLKIAFTLLNCLKMPLPALILDKPGNIEFTWLHY